MKIIIAAVLLALTAFASFAQKEKTPDPAEYVEVDVAPEPLTPLQSLVVYPEEARRNGTEGQVIISALIDETGSVVKVQIEKSTDPIFDEPAKRALLAAKFKPAMHDGEAVKLWYTVPITFKLTRKFSDHSYLSLRPSHNLRWNGATSNGVAFDYTIGDGPNLNLLTAGTEIRSIERKEVAIYVDYLRFFTESDMPKGLHLSGGLGLGFAEQAHLEVRLGAGYSVPFGNIVAMILSVTNRLVVMNDLSPVGTNSTTSLGLALAFKF